MKRNKFNLSHYKLGSADMGKLYPISCFEVLPGDTVQMHSSVFLRMAPMVAPVMHPVKVSLYSFFVPNRLLWDDWEDFITGGPDGLDVSEPPMIHFGNGGVSQGSIADYLGAPVGYTGKMSLLPLRAYGLIFNEYFRDQDLYPDLNIATDGGDHYDENSGNPRNVSWEKDYFTTCRPWPQKGASVTVPVNGVTGGSFDVKGNGRRIDQVGVDGYDDVSNNHVNGPTSHQATIDQNWRLQLDNEGLATPANNVNAGFIIPNLVTIGKVTLPSGNNASVRLDDLREAFALQRFEEHRSVYGSRYTEYLRYLGVRARDSRLQRPEYLGGGKTTIQFSEVLQTAADGNNPVGTLRGHGIGVNRGSTFRRFIEEHGLVMTLMTIRPIAIYMNGLNRMFSRETKEDYWQRELEHIGQQEVLTKELYATGNTSSQVNDNTVFGYANRYDDYRSVPSTVCGEMRSTLDYWHMARSFNNAPVLNQSFVYGSPTKRIFAEQTMNEIYFMAQHSVVVRRILSKMGNPIL